jgi:putative two-component system response regulator
LRIIKEMPFQLESFLKLGDAVIITNHEHIIVNINTEFEHVTGYSKDDTIGKNAGFMKSNMTPKSTYTSLKKMIKEGKSWSGVFVNRKKTGEIWHSSITISPIQVEMDLYFVGVFRELEQLKQGIYLSENKRIETQRELLKVLAISCEIRDPGIEEHLLRVQELTELLVNAHVQKHHLEISKNIIHHIIHASILHDIGKSGIPEGILYKPGPLTSYERKIIEMHPLMGADIINKFSKELHSDLIIGQDIIRNIILYHHEKWDGTGYPYKLSGEDIPFEARIVTVVDVYDALTSRRPYKDAWTREKALSFLIEQNGKQFDPLIVETFIDL